MSTDCQIIAIVDPLTLEIHPIFCSYRHFEDIKKLHYHLEKYFDANGEYMKDLYSGGVTLTRPFIAARKMIEYPFVATLDVTLYHNPRNDEDYLSTCKNGFTLVCAHTYPMVSVVPCYAYEDKYAVPKKEKTRLLKKLEDMKNASTNLEYEDENDYVPKDFAVKVNFKMEYFDFSILRRKFDLPARFVDKLVAILEENYEDADAVFSYGDVKDALESIASNKPLLYNNLKFKREWVKNNVEKLDATCDMFGCKSAATHSGYCKLHYVDVLEYGEDSEEVEKIRADFNIPKPGPNNNNNETGTPLDNGNTITNYNITMDDIEEDSSSDNEEVKRKKESNKKKKVEFKLPSGIEKKKTNNRTKKIKKSKGVTNEDLLEQMAKMQEQISKLSETKKIQEPPKKILPVHHLMCCYKNAKGEDQRIDLGMFTTIDLAASFFKKWINNDKNSELKVMIKNQIKDHAPAYRRYGPRIMLKFMNPMDSSLPEYIGIQQHISGYNMV